LNWQNSCVKEGLSLHGETCGPASEHPKTLCPDPAHAWRGNTGKAAEVSLFRSSNGRIGSISAGLASVPASAENTNCQLLLAVETISEANAACTSDSGQKFSRTQLMEADSGIREKGLLPRNEGQGPSGGCNHRSQSLSSLRTTDPSPLAIPEVGNLKAKLGSERGTDGTGLGFPKGDSAETFLSTYAETYMPMTKDAVVATPSIEGTCMQ
jgi:hypothetical protein